MELTVRFLVRETGVVVDKRFDSYIACRNFVNRCRHSRKVQLIFTLHSGIKEIWEYVRENEERQ